jgi:hypothetical protein
MKSLHFYYSGVFFKSCFIVMQIIKGDIHKLSYDNFTKRLKAVVP